MTLSKTLDKRISIQQTAQGSDEEGNPLTGWTEVTPAWANIRVLSGLEALKAGGVVSTIKASIRIRERAGLTADMRIVHKGDVYNILAVPPLLGRSFMDLICEQTK